MTDDSTYLVTASRGYGKIDERRVDRAYDFNKGDERRTSLDQAIEAARIRALETDTAQQVRPSTGPLHGATMWLIQSVNRNVQVPLDELGRMDLDDLRRLVRHSSHLPGSSPVAIESTEEHPLVLVAHDVE